MKGSFSYHLKALKRTFKRRSGCVPILPAHQLIQLIDPIAQLRKWVKKVYHVHGKDATVDRRMVEDYGVLCDTDWYAPERTPGFGDSDWRDIIYILHTRKADSGKCQ